MPPVPQTAAEFIERLARIKRWQQDGVRAPHKPLLLLLMLSRLAKGEGRVVRFAEIEDRLRGLIEEFGPTRKSYYPELPFWHLQSDGIWEISNRAGIDRTNGDSPSAAYLRKINATGGLPAPVWDELRANPVLARAAVQAILDNHFAESCHEDLLIELGLTGGAHAAVEAKKPDGRTAEFREMVLGAYLNRCAVCGFNGQFNSKAFGVEAAHVRWHSFQGPSTLDNGLCLCVLHHKALDRGVIGLTDDLRVAVSPRLQKNDHTYGLFHAFDKSILLPPVDNGPTVARDHVLWHRVNCFRG